MSDAKRPPRRDADLSDNVTKDFWIATRRATRSTSSRGPALNGFGRLRSPRAGAALLRPQGNPPASPTRRIGRCAPRRGGAEPAGATYATHGRDATSRAWLGALDARRGIHRAGYAEGKARPRRTRATSSSPGHFGEARVIPAPTAGARARRACAAREHDDASEGRRAAGRCDGRRLVRRGRRRKVVPRERRRQVCRQQMDFIRCRARLLRRVPLRHRLSSHRRRRPWSASLSPPSLSPSSQRSRRFTAMRNLDCSGNSRPRRAPYHRALQRPPVVKRGDVSRSTRDESESGAAGARRGAWNRRRASGDFASENPRRRKAVAALRPRLPASSGETPQPRRCRRGATTRGCRRPIPSSSPPSVRRGAAALRRRVAARPIQGAPAETPAERPRRRWASSVAARSGALGLLLFPDGHAPRARRRQRRRHSGYVQRRATSSSASASSASAAVRAPSMSGRAQRLRSAPRATRVVVHAGGTASCAQDGARQDEERGASASSAPPSSTRSSLADH